MSYEFQSSWPIVSRRASDIEKLYGKSPLGLDLEFDSNDRITILGLSDGTLTISVPWSEGREYLCTLLHNYPETVFVGHNLCSADIPLLATNGIDISLDNVEDTILLHYLTSPHLCKATGKASLDEEAGASDRRGRGFMNLGTMCSIHTSLAYWKECIGEEACLAQKRPCPEHAPYEYNGIDALAGVLALPSLKRVAAFRQVDSLYSMHKELMATLAEIRDFGVRIDVSYVKQLKQEFEEEKEAAAKELPFNPDSPKQIMEYFRGKGIELENAQEETIRELVEELGDEALPQLIALLDYKELGNGPDRWFAPRYRDDNGWWKGFMDEVGFVHPNQTPFTSSSRLACANPNFHNVVKRRLSRKQCKCEHPKTEHVSIDGKLKCTRCECQAFSGYPIGKKIRRAIIAPDEWFIVKGDFSNAENRCYLYLSGYEPPEGDLHDWMVKNIGLTEQDEFAIRLGGARDASKSVTHAVDYGEGLQLKEPSQLRTPKIKKEIECGARLVFPEWKFRDKVVTFSGINLANRAFGDATLANRAKANAISARYIDQTFPKIRDLQKRIFKQVEQQSAVYLPMGYCTLMYGKDEDMLKTALSIWGSGPIAHLLKTAILTSWREFKRGRQQRLVLSVHDELLTFTHRSISPDEGCAWLAESMDVEDISMPGFRVPSAISYGDNWRDQTKWKR